MVEIKTRVYPNEPMKVVKIVKTVDEAISYIEGLRFYVPNAKYTYAVCR